MPSPVTSRVRKRARLRSGKVMVMRGRGGATCLPGIRIACRFLPEFEATGIGLCWFEGAASHLCQRTADSRGPNLQRLRQSSAPHTARSARMSRGRDSLRGARREEDFDEHRGASPPTRRSLDETRRKLGADSTWCRVIAADRAAHRSTIRVSRTRTVWSIRGWGSRRPRLPEHPASRRRRTCRS
jgi:hypothetical protein